MMKSLTCLLLFSILKLSRCQFYPIFNRSPLHHPNTYFIVRPHLYNTIEYSSHVPTILIAKAPHMHPLQTAPLTQQSPPSQEHFPQTLRNHQPSFETSRNGQQQQFQVQQPKPFHTANKAMHTNVQNSQNRVKQTQQNVQRLQPVQLQGGLQQPQLGFQPIQNPRIYLIFLQKPAPVYKYSDSGAPQALPRHKSRTFEAESNSIQPGGQSKYPQAYPLPHPPQSVLAGNIKMVVLHGPSFTPGGGQSNYLGHKPVSAQFVARVYSVQKQPYLYQYKNNFFH